MPQIPRFDLPFRYVRGRAVVNEQGSLDDTAACVTAVCLVRPGDLPDLPDFGLPDPTFAQEPIRPGDIIGPIARWEPDAKVLLELAPSKYDDAVVNANLNVEP